MIYDSNNQSIQRIIKYQNSNFNHLTKDKKVINQNQKKSIDSNIENNKNLKLFLKNKIESKINNTENENEDIENKKNFLKKDSSKVILPPVNSKVSKPVEFITSGFKFRFYVAITNNFHKLFKPLFKCKTTEWIEIAENEPLFCNYIHVSNRNEEKNLKELPKNSENKLSF